MDKKIYKYFSQDVLELVFEKEGYCGIKCSLPKDYNDPFELFLGVDLSVGPEGLATYRELIYELPQYPTTCFSKSPVVAPMWAHYAQNHSGFAIEFDVDAMEEALPNVAIHNVTYRNEPDESISANIARAAGTKKPRHAVWLQQAVIHHAYFSKYPMWSYEEECRLVDNGETVEPVGDNSILFVPIHCMTALIIGKNFPDSEIMKSKDLAAANDLTWFQSNIGKSLALPFLRDTEQKAFVFDGISIAEAELICDACKEPFEGEGESESELCPWCSITEQHQYEAAIGNPFRLLERTGGLDDYFAFVQKIHKNNRKS
jgi:Protein of unknown function (DUF2971)